MIISTPLPLQLANGVDGFWYLANQFPTGLTAVLPGKMFGTPAAQAISANQPNNTLNAIGGKSALKFNGSTSALSAASSSRNSNIFGTGGTLAFVVKVIGMGGASFGRLFDKTILQLYVSNLSGSTCKLSFQQGTSGVPGTWAFTNNLITLGQPFIFVVTYNSSTLATAPKMYINSTTEVAVSVTSAPTGSASSDAGNNLVLGNRAALDRGFDGDIAEIFAVKKILNDGQINQLIQYFKSNYGIA